MDYCLQMTTQHWRTTSASGNRLAFIYISFTCADLMVGRPEWGEPLPLDGKQVGSLSSGNAPFYPRPSTKIPKEGKLHFVLDGRWARK